MLSKTRSRKRFNDAVLVVGIDIGKERHVAVADGPGGVVTKPLAVGNTLADFEKLVTWIRQVSSQLGTTEVIIGMEPTGHYWKPLGEWLQRHGFTLRLVSPVLTKRAKDMLDGSPLKSDSKDAAVIAELIRQGYSRPISSQQPVFQELRYLAEMRQRLVRERTALLNRLHRLLDLLFPELVNLFCRLDIPTVLTLLTVAPTPVQVLALGRTELIALLRRSSRGQLGEAKAEAILTAAHSSIACQHGVQALLIDLQMLLPRIEELVRIRKEVEGRMAKALEQVPYAEQLLSIPRLGRVTAAVILGELGDLRLYRNARQVLKMAGLNLYEISSGKHQGDQRITKRGRTQLRHMLYLAALRMFQEGCPLHGLHQKQSPLKPGPKVAVTGMRRLLKAIFAMVRDEQRFNHQQFEVRPTMQATTGLAA